MSYPESVRKTARKLALEGFSAEKIAETFSKEAQKGKHDYTPTPRAIRNWLKREQREDKVPESIITEARKRHHDSIDRLIEGLKNVIYTLDIHRIEEFKSEAIYSIEDNPLFVCLKEHLPFPNIWEDYNNWRNKYFTYYDSCHSLFKRIQREGFTKKQRKDLKIYSILSGFREHILDNIQYINPWRGIFGRDTRDWRDNVEYGIDPYQSEAFFYSSLGDIGRQELIVDGYHVLVAEDALAISHAYQSVADDILGSPDVVNIKRLFWDLRAIEKRLQKAFEDILIRSDYLNNQCSLCPGSPAKDSFTPSMTADLKIYENSASILGETAFGTILNGLAIENSYYGSSYEKVRHYMEFLEEQDNRYQNNKLQSLREQLNIALHCLDEFIVVEFKQSRRKSDRKSDVFRLSTRKHSYIDIENQINTLHKLCQDCVETYSTYRTAIAELLLI